MKFSVFGNSQSDGKTISVSALKHAIERDQLILYFMPVIDIERATTVELEALLRWPKTDEEFIAPLDFIPVTEQHGLMPMLTRWVMQQMIKQMASWKARGTEINCSINLSVNDLSDTDLIQDIQTELKQHQIKPGLFGIEVAHSMLQRAPKKVFDWLAKLKSADVRITLDNFDVKADLTQLAPVDLWDSLKIERTVVMGANSNQEYHQRVKHLTNLENFGMVICASGVHGFHEWELVKELNCDQAQGYYLSPPQAAAEIELWLRISTWGFHKQPYSDSLTEVHQKRMTGESH